MTKKSPPDEASPPPPRRRGRKLIMFILLLMAAGGGAAGYYVTGGFAKAEAHEDPRRPQLVERSKEPAEASAASGEEEKAPRRVGTVSVKDDRLKVDPKRFEIAYYPIEQAFTANLADGTGFAQVGISVSTFYDSRVGDNLQRQMVPIRSAVLMVLSNQHAEQLATPEGKLLLQRDLTQAINHVLREKEDFGGIDNVYFSSLVVQ